MTTRKEAVDFKEFTAKVSAIFVQCLVGLFVILSCVHL